MRNFRLFGALALCAVMMPSLTSCSDDDDDKGGDGTGVSSKSKESDCPTSPEHTGRILSTMIPKGVSPL